MDKYYLTKERLGELAEELERLKTVRRREVAERLKSAKEYGDLSENNEYTEAREEQERIESRIFELEDLLKRVVIIKKSDDIIQRIGDITQFTRFGNFVNRIAILKSGDMIHGIGDGRNPVP